MAHERCVIFTALVEQVCAADLAQSLTQVDQAVETANRELDAGTYQMCCP